MDFLRFIADDLQALRHEIRRKFPVVKEAVDKASEVLPQLQQEYAARVRTERRPGPGDPLFRNDVVLRPFLLACNHTNASHKVTSLALAGIQRLVSWDAVAPSSVGSIMRVLQLQAEKTTHADVQVKLLQTLLQLVTLAYEAESKASSSSKAAQNEMQTLEGEKEDLVLQAIWICFHLHATSSHVSSVVGNTAAVTVRQVVSLAFDTVTTNAEAKHVGILVLQELCFISREENGMKLKGTARSPMTAALGVELVEAILASHHATFKSDTDLQTVLRQQIRLVIQSALQSGCSDRYGHAHATSVANASSGLTIGSFNSSSSGSGSQHTSGPTPFFPMLVRVMRLANVVLCYLSEYLEQECASIVRSLIQIVSTGDYQPTTPHESEDTSAADAKNFMESVKHANSTNGTSMTLNFVTWQAFLALEVLNRVCADEATVAAMTSFKDPLLSKIAQATASVIATSPATDFRPHVGSDAPPPLPRSGLEHLNDQEPPPLQQFFSAIRIAVTCQNNLLSSLMELSKDPEVSSDWSTCAVDCVDDIAPYIMHSMNGTMRHCREVDIITLALKSFHLLATTASHLRSKDTVGGDRETKMEYVLVGNLRALCWFAFPPPQSVQDVDEETIVNDNGIELIAAYYQESSVSSTSTGFDVMISWREVHAMKMLLGAAHIMVEELSTSDWTLVLEAFEVTMGLTDSRQRNGHFKLPVKDTGIRALKLHNEDVEQQLVMLGKTVDEFFQKVLQLSSEAHAQLLAALSKVFRKQTCVPSLMREDKDLWKRTSSSTSVDKVIPPSFVDTEYHLHVYQTYLGIGLSGSSGFLPPLSLRKLITLSACSKTCFDKVTSELVAIATFVPVSQDVTLPLLPQLQTYVTDNILQLMQNALLQPGDSKEFDQKEVFQPLQTLTHSDMRDRMLNAMLDLLNACGHLIATGWPLIFDAIRQAGELGEAKTQVVAFKCLRLIVDDLLSAAPSEHVPNCVLCVSRFATCAKDVNISLTAVNALWSVADILGKRQEESSSTWQCLFQELSSIALDGRAEVRNCALDTLFGLAVTYGSQFSFDVWQLFIDTTVLPLAEKLRNGSVDGSEAKAATPKGGFVMHHSRDSSEKQWDESRVLLLAGIGRVFHTNSHHLLSRTTWISSVWTRLLDHISQSAARGSSKEVVLTAITTLQTLLQVASMSDLDASSVHNGVRVGTGMRVVDGALVPSSSSQVNKRPSATKPKVERDPALWQNTFHVLLHLCQNRRPEKEPAWKDESWREEDEQEIASAVVAVIIKVYVQCKEHEFKDERNVRRILDLFEALLTRHVLRADTSSKVISVGTNSLQSRVLNAFEECESFAAHPGVHSKVVAQMVKYIAIASAQNLPFFTRHALITMAKLYASVSPTAQNDEFLSVLSCVRPFLYGNAQSYSDQSGTTLNPAAQKAVTQLWKHALQVLLVLISQGLSAVQLRRDCWQPLLETVERFLRLGSGRMPSVVEGEEDETLVLGVLECLVDTAIALLDEPSLESSTSPSKDEKQESMAFYDDLMRQLSDGIQSSKYHKAIVASCVRQLNTLAIQQQGPWLAARARHSMVECCNLVLEQYVADAKAFHSKDLVRGGTNGRQSSESTTKERLVVMLKSASEVQLSAPNVLVMYRALCKCITTSDSDVRDLVQRLLLSGQVSEYCLELISIHGENAAL